MFRQRLQSAFDGVKYKLTYYDDMDEWLKCHIAFILPIVYVCYAVNGDLTRSTVEQRKAIVDAAWECCEMLKAAGVPVNDAENTDYYREGTKKRKQTDHRKVVRFRPRDARHRRNAVPRRSLRGPACKHPSLHDRVG